MLHFQIYSNKCYVDLSQYLEAFCFWQVLKILFCSMVVFFKPPLWIYICPIYVSTTDLTISTTIKSYKRGRHFFFVWYYSLLSGFHQASILKSHVLLKGNSDICCPSHSEQECFEVSEQQIVDAACKTGGHLRHRTSGTVSSNSPAELAASRRPVLQTRAAKDL